MRKLTLSPTLNGFWAGLLAGSAAAVPALDPAPVTLPRLARGLTLDCEAIRRDRQKVQTQLDADLARIAARAI